MIKVEKTGENNRVGLITLNRAKPHNALCNQLMDELADSLQKMDKDKTFGVIIVTGCEKVFATGADIREMVFFNFSYFFIFQNFLRLQKNLLTFLVPDFLKIGLKFLKCASL